MMKNGTGLLADYLSGKTESSFRAIVEAHSPMVMATATRKLNGNAVAAQDVSQQVFLRLAKSAQKFTPDMCLSGWLYRQTCRISVDSIRSENRRRARETTAASLMKNDSSNDYEEVLGEIDEALGELNDSDRDALVLRYLEEQSHRAVGEKLGVSEEAARKRCQRAVDSLREVFARRSVKVGSTALVAALSGLTSQPLSAATIQQISTSAFQPSSAATGIGSGLLSLAGGFLAASVVAGGVYLSQKDEGELPSKSLTARSRMISSREHSKRSAMSETIEVGALIAEIKRLYLEPRNELMELKLAALFETLPASERGEFFRQTKSLLTKHEKIFAYRPIFESLMDASAREAFDLILAERIVSDAWMADLGAFDYLFGKWEREASEESEEWLRLNWGHEDLEIDAFDATLQSGFAGIFVSNALQEKGVKVAFEMAKSFGDQDDFVPNLRRITGTLWHSVDQRYAVGIYQEIRALSDEKLREEMTKDFLGSWRGRHGPHLLESLSSLSPADRIPAALSVLTYQSPLETITNQANGATRHHYEHPPKTGEKWESLLEGRENELREIAVESGIGEGVIELRMMMQYLEEQNESFVNFLDRFSPNRNFDEAIIAGLRKLCANHNRGSAKVEALAFRGALSISDPERRLGVVRALYHRIYAKNANTAKEMLNDEGFPEDVATALRETASSLGL